MLYAFHVRDHYPERDLGIWRHFLQHDRDHSSAFKRMAWLMCGSFIGSLIGYLISLYDPCSTSPLHAFLLRYPALPLLALAASTIITIAILPNGARRKAQA